MHQFNVFSVHRPTQHALADYLQDASTYESLPSFFAEKRDLLLELMNASRFKPLLCKGTYFCNFDYSAISDEPDRDFARRLTTEYGVAAIPVSAFYSSRRDDRVIRLCFAKTAETLRSAGELLAKV